MPLGGLLPYPDDERRRRLLEDALSPGLPQGGRGRSVPMLTPPINPDAPPPNVPMPTRRPGIPLASPDITGTPAPRPAPLPPFANPDMANAPLPEFTPRPITRVEELEGAKAEYLARTPGRFKSGLRSALLGFAQGLQTGGGLGAGLGGALAGGAFGAINPRGAREMEFEMFRKPRILERFALEDQERAARLAEEKARREKMAAVANIANIESQIESRRDADALNRSRFEYEQNKPLIIEPGSAVFDPTTRQPIFQADKPLTSTDPSLDIDPTSGKSYQQIAIDSYMNRGGDAYVLAHMSPIQQELIRNGTINGQPASPEEINAALRAFEAAKQRQLQIDMDYTRGSVRAGNISGRRRSGGKPGATPRKQSSSGVVRSRSEFNSARFPGLKFD